MQNSYSPSASALKELGIAMLRVSTDRQFQIGDSIETQKIKSDHTADYHNIELVRYFIEHFSGRKEDRATINEVIEFLEDNPNISYVIIPCIDRFTRVGVENYLYLKRQMARLKVHLIDAAGVIQKEVNTLAHTGFEYDWSRRSPSHTAEIIMADYANTEVCTMLTRMIGQQINLNQQGYQVRNPTYGYKNQKHITSDGKERYILVPHEEEAKYIRHMFRLAALGSYSDKEICERLNAMGYRSRVQNTYDPQTRRVIGKRGENKLYAKQLRRYLEHPIFCGIRSEKWTNYQPIKDKGVAIVSIETFNQANQGKIVIKALKGDQYSIESNKADYKNHRHNPEFLFRHVVLCPHCQKPFVASKPKGKLGARYGYYHCARKHKYLGVKKAEFEETIAKTLLALEAKPAFLPILKEVVREVWVQKNKASEREKSAIKTHIAELETKQRQILDSIHQSSSAIVRKKLEDDVEALEQNILSAKSQQSEKEITELQIERFFEIAKKLMEHPKEFIFEASTKAQIEKLWGFVFAKAPSYQELLDGTPELTLIYRLSGGAEHTQGQMAECLSLEWNTFCADIRHAQNLAPYCIPSSK